MFTIVRKELLSFVKDRRALFLTFLVPIVLITIFALAFGGAGNNTNLQTMPLLVVDEDHTPASRDIVSSIDSVKMIEPIPAPNDSALYLIKTGKKFAALVIHKGFSDSVQSMKPLPWELEFDEAQSQQIGMLQQLLEQAIYGKIGQEMMKKINIRNIENQFGKDMDSNARKNIMAQINNNMEGTNKDVKNMRQETMKLTMTSVVKSAQDSAGMVQAVAGTAVMMLLFGLIGMGGRILEEKENGTLKRLLYSPLSSNAILSGKMASSIIIAFIQLMVLLIFAWIAFGLHLWHKILPVTILAISTAFACSGFGAFMASVVKSREQLQGMSTLVVLSMSALGGSMIPTFMMPAWMQNISPFTINYWSIQGFYDIFWRQLPIGSIFLMRIAILLCIGFTLTAVSFRFFRKNTLSMV